MSGPKRYRKKSIPVEAMIFDGHNGADIVQWMGNSTTDCGKNLPGQFYVRHEHGTLYASPGDYIVKNAEGKFFPRNRASMEQYYEEEQA
jgi:hypothetical protein